MRRSGIGLVMLLIVALLVAWLALGSMRSLGQTASVPTGAGGKSAVEQAQSVVDMANARIDQYTDSSGSNNAG